jgi:hypothetical protein
MLDAKLQKHTESSLKRREPAILTLTKNYNDLCRQLRSLIHQKKAPAGAILPLEIPREGVFKLDVDDDIWQDVGLSDEHHGPAPLWLRDDQVRKGIKSMLQLDRCKEEEARLLRERQALQEWMQEEWKVVQKAKEIAGMFYVSALCITVLQGIISGDDEDLIYQLDLHAQELCQLCVTWRSKLRPIPTNMNEFWGPPDSVLQQASELEFNPRWEDDSDTEEDYQSGEESDDSGEDWGGVRYDNSDGDLVESLEALAFSDEYRLQDAEDIFPHFSDFAADKYRASSSSPTKRPRALSP